MESPRYTTTLGQILAEHKMEVIYAPDGYESIQVLDDDVNRPGLQLAGYFDYFNPEKIQIMGRIEWTFMENYTPERRLASFEKLFERKIPCMIFSRGLPVFPECVQAAEKYGVPVFVTGEFTSAIVSSLTASLRLALAPRVTLHGVLVEIYGEGILILGDSGVGKSETAIELVKRGHRLIADDAVEIKRVSSITLVGTAPELIRHFIELRGIGIVDVRNIFGMGAVKMTEKVDLVINLETWEDGKAYDRLGLDRQYMNILDIQVPSITVPVKPGRNLAVIIEVAAMSNRQRKMGFNAAQELTDRMSEAYGMPRMQAQEKEK